MTNRPIPFPLGSAQEGEILPLGPIRFVAALAERSGFSRDRDGGMLRLEVPESEIAAMIGVLALTGERLQITIEVCRLNRQEPADGRQNQDFIPARKQRKSRWAPAEESGTH